MVIGKDERWSAKDAEPPVASYKVFTNRRQHGPVFNILFELLHVEIRLASDVQERLAFPVIPTIGVLRFQQRKMESLKRLLTLTLGRERRPERREALAPVALRLLPELPIRSLRGVYLLQRKGPPIYLKRLSRRFLDIPQPDRCGIDEWSTIVEINVDGPRILHLSNPFDEKIRLTPQSLPRRCKFSIRRRWSLDSR